ncbi:MAG: sugar ABC transporter ATP-binding protein [Planctomycetes bacterium]|nr:sugar ABC transporter ATP-binding protein [Planctomycetota bacterium]
MTSPLPVVELRRIRKRFDQNEVLRGASLSLFPGEIHALIGENGAGKSTLMNILFGMPVIHRTGGYEGEIRIDGQPAEPRTPEQARALGLGMVHQEFQLIEGFTAAENIKLNREPLRGGLMGRLSSLCGGRLSRLETLDRRRLRGEARAALTRLGVEVPENRVIGELPVGHRQFVEIAREIDRRQVRALILDEPTAVLTESAAELLLRTLRALARSGAAVLLITHRLEEVKAVADRFTVLRDGEVVLSGSVAATSLETMAEAMCGRSLRADPRSGSAAAEDGAAIQGGSNPSAQTGRPLLLKLENLQVDMPGEAVRGADLEVRAGEILGIGGLAGQGKAGIAGGLFGLYPARGRAWLEGAPLPLGRPREALRRGLAFLPEDRRGTGLWLEETLALNMASSAMLVQGRFLRWPLLGPLSGLDRKALSRHARRWIEELDIRCEGPQDRPIRLSGGNQQKVALARVLALDPKLLFIAEPTRGIDIGAKERILRLLRDRNREKGTTVVMVSSELEELRQLCHRIAIISAGQVAGILPAGASPKEFGLLLGGKRRKEPDR